MGATPEDVSIMEFTVNTLMMEEEFALHSGLIWQFAMNSYERPGKRIDSQSNLNQTIWLLKKRKHC
jgi:hypothetical protein